MAEQAPDEKRPPATFGRWRRARQAAQVLVLLLFFYLLLGTRPEGATVLPHETFFLIDPLAGISTMLAGRHWVPALAVGGLTLVLALALGRFWCGWLCPLGTILDWTPGRRSRGSVPDAAGRWRHTKHLVLATILLSAALGSLTLLILDPLTLLFRAVGNALLPAFTLAATTVEGWLYKIELLQQVLQLILNY